MIGSDVGTSREHVVCFADAPVVYNPDSKARWQAETFLHGEENRIYFVKVEGRVGEGRYRVDGDERLRKFVAEAVDKFHWKRDPCAGLVVRESDRVWSSLFNIFRK